MGGPDDGAGGRAVTDIGAADAATGARAAPDAPTDGRADRGRAVTDGGSPDAGGETAGTEDRNADDADPVLRVESIDTYYGSSHVLHGVSLSVGRGEIVTLVGRNGAGKTTTLRSVMGLTPPASGRVVFGGEEIQGLPPYEVRRRGVSWVPEDRRVFPDLTVGENVRLAASAGDGDRDTAHVYDLFPRLDERRHQPVGTMSGGEQQMLAIARALVGPETGLLMLDEPSEGLAPVIIEDLRETVRELNEGGVSVLLVEQNADLALDVADRAYVIETGRIEYGGDAATLRDDEDLLREYLGVQ